MYYNTIMHPLVAGEFATINDVEAAITGAGGSLDSLEVGDENWRLVETVKSCLHRSTFANPVLASPFHRLPGTVDRFGFSYGVEDVLFSGVLIADAGPRRWDPYSPLVISDRIRQTFGTAPELFPLAAHLVENTKGSINDRT